VLPLSAATALEVPFLTGRVNDTADLIDAGTRDRLEERLAAYEAETGAQIAVLTIRSLQGENLEEFSIRVAETWGLGREGVDDGILVLVAHGDRKMRIEVGYGLEDRLTDLQAGRVLDNIMRPSFRAGDFSGGIEQGVGAILDTLGGREVNALVSAPPRQNDMPLVGRVIGLAIFTINVGLFSIIALFSTGFGSWFLYFFLMPFYFLFPMFLIRMEAGPIMFGLWLIGFPILKFLMASAPGKDYINRHPRLKKAFKDRGTWSWSSGGGGGFSGGGGGFSGGGGSFGGGGSSGSW
jgi:uncharacterized protein